MKIYDEEETDIKRPASVRVDAGDVTVANDLSAGSGGDDAPEISLFLPVLNEEMISAELRRVVATAAGG